MNIVNKVRVTICGREYNLQTDETPEYLIGLAARVDKEINALVKSKPNFGVQNAAVFVALTSLDEARKASDSIDNIRGQIKTYVDDAAKARAAKEKQMTRVKELETKIAELEKEIKELKKGGAGGCEQLVLENTISPAVTIYAEENQQSSADTPAEENAAVAAEDEPKADNASSGSEPEPEQQNLFSEQDDAGGAQSSEAENDGNSTSDADMTAEKGNSGNRRKKKRR